MKKTIYLALSFLLIFEFLSAQRVELIPFIGFQYTNICYNKKADDRQNDFKKNSPKIAENYGLSIQVQKKIIHQLTIQNVIIGHSFEIKNNYLLRTPEKLLGFGKLLSQGGDDHVMMKYSVGQVSDEIPVLNKRCRFSYAVGSAIVFDKSKNYYENVFGATFWSAGSYDSSSGNFYEYNVSLKNHNFGISICINAGIKFYNKKGKTGVTAEVFYYKGFKQVKEYNVSYKYGYTQYPQYYRENNKVKNRTRGTILGLQIGIPIRLG